MSHTAVIVEPGSMYFDARRGRIVSLAESHAAVVCRAPGCEWTLHMPTRLGFDLIEEARRTHLKSAHLSGLISGQVVLTEPGSSGSVFASSSSGREVRGAVEGELGTTEADGRPLLRPLTVSSVGETSRRAPASVVPTSRSG
jgi:hypothetical protein